jgi:hypothetical protein
MCSGILKWPCLRNNGLISLLPKYNPCHSHQWRFMIDYQMIITSMYQAVCNAGT